MFYRFNCLTNRLISATHMLVYQPEGLTPLSKVTSLQEFMESKERGKKEETPVKKEEPRLISTTLASTPTRKSSRYAPLSPRIKELQELFQKDDGVPVHLKRGDIDYALYYTTVALAAFGTSWVIYDIIVTAMRH